MEVPVVTVGHRPANFKMHQRNSSTVVPVAIGVCNFSCVKVRNWMSQRPTTFVGGLCCCKQQAENGSGRWLYMDTSLGEALPGTCILFRVDYYFIWIQGQLSHSMHLAQCGPNKLPLNRCTKDGDNARLWLNIIYINWWSEYLRGFAKYF